jgi:L-ascorbate metabolism protein UlaG (beta-lactamase superfamily)
MKKNLLILYPLLIILFSFNYNTFVKAIKDLPYHHLPDGTFRNPEGSPERNMDNDFSYFTFIKEKKKIKINIPTGHIVDKKEVLKNLEKYKNDNYIVWIGHATFLIKLGNAIIITDPFFSKFASPFSFIGPKRYVDAAIELKDLPETNLLMLSHNHYDSLDYRTIKNFPYKNTKVLVPLGLSKYFIKNGFDDVNELDWYNQIKVNDLNITLMPAVHSSQRTLTDYNKSLWGSFLIEYKNIKIFFACDTGYGNIYKELGKKYGPIDLTFINIGSYNFKPMFEKSINHSTPEEALNIGEDLLSKKVLGMHWGTIMLSLEEPFEPPVRFKNAANKYGYHKDDAIIFKIGEVQKLENLLQK